MRSDSQFDFDVVIASDFRYPGGNSSSIVEEIKAQAAAGLRTGLVHLPAGHMKRRRSFNHKIIYAIAAGMATLIPAYSKVSAKLLIIRQPRIFADVVDMKVSVQADSVLLVANHPPFDGRFPKDKPYYEPDEVQAQLDRLFGRRALWAPIGPQIREALDSYPNPTFEQIPDDWHNIVDVAEWRAPRDRFVADSPVLGRHSRNHWVKWPDSEEDILAAYPERDDLRIRILGGADAAIATLGRTPDNWTIYPFGFLQPMEFLRGIDFFVYFHHSEWVEAFGRTTIEALASGAPAVLPRHFEPLFGEAALYGEPQDVMAIVERYYRDHGAYTEQSEYGQAFVEESFGQAVHIDRMEVLSEGTLGARPRRSPAPSPYRAKILLVAMNSTGGGSVSRLLRIARELHGEVEPIFLVGPSQLREVQEAGHLADQMPNEGLAKDGAHPPGTERLLEVIEREKPTLMVVDGRSMRRGVEAVIEKTGIPCVWVTTRQHAMPGRKRCEKFAAVFRVSAVSGPVESNSLVQTIPPLDNGAEETRSSLGASGTRALVALGTHLRARLLPSLPIVVDLLRKTGYSVDVADLKSNTLAGRIPNDSKLIELDWKADLSRYDLAVIAPRHTLLHDLLRAEVPTVVLDDDQASRAPRMPQLGGPEAAQGPVPVAVDTEELAAAIASISEAPQGMVTEDGTQIVARSILRLLGVSPRPLPVDASAGSVR